MTDDAEARRAFEREMAAIYDGAKRIGYNATRFLVMVREHGGLETAHRLLASADVSYGFTELWMLGRQDLTVEALVLRPDYQVLFSAVELRTARDRLGVVAATLPNPQASPPSAQAARWSLESFRAAASGRGAVVDSLVQRFAEWIGPSALRLGDGPTGPIYFAPRDSQGVQVSVVALSLDGNVEVLFNHLAAHRPFDGAAGRIELQRRLNQIVGFEVRDEVVETSTWQTIDAAYLLSPGAFRQFTEAFDWVAARLATGTMGART